MAGTPWYDYQTGEYRVDDNPADTVDPAIAAQAEAELAHLKAKDPNATSQAVYNPSTKQWNLDVSFDYNKFLPKALQGKITGEQAAGIQYYKEDPRKSGVKLVNPDAVWYDPEYGWYMHQNNIYTKKTWQDKVSNVMPTAILALGTAGMGPAVSGLAKAGFSAGLGAMRGLAADQKPLDIAKGIGLNLAASYLGSLAGDVVRGATGTFDTGVGNPFGSGNFSIDPGKIVGGMMASTAKNTIGGLVNGSSKSSGTPRTGGTGSTTTAGGTNMGADATGYTPIDMNSDPSSIWTNFNWDPNSVDPNQNAGIGPIDIVGGGGVWPGGSSTFDETGGFSGGDNWPVAVDGNANDPWGFLGETTGQGGGLGDIFGGGLGGIGDIFTGNGNGLQNSALAMAAILGPLALQQYMGAGELQDIGVKAAGLADPFGSQRAQYQKQLSDLYTHPEEFLANPEHQAVVEKQLNRIQSRNRAAGYMGSGKDMTDLADFQSQSDAQYLDAEKARLAALSGAQFGPDAAAQLYAQGGMNKYNAQNMGLGTLAQMFSTLLGGAAAGNATKQSPITINNNNQATGGTGTGGSGTGGGGTGGTGNGAGNIPNAATLLKTPQMQQILNNLPATLRTSLAGASPEQILSTVINYGGTSGIFDEITGGYNPGFLNQDPFGPTGGITGQITGTGNIFPGGINDISNPDFNITPDMFGQIPGFNLNVNDFGQGTGNNFDFLTEGFDPNGFDFGMTFGD